MKRRPAQPGTTKFVFIAIVLMLLADQFIFGGTRPYIEDARQVARERQAQETARVPEFDGPPVRVAPPEVDYFESLPDEEAVIPEEEILSKHEPLPEEKAPKPAEPVMVPEEDVSMPEVVPPPKKGMKIAIVIDDLGMNVKNSKRIMDLPAPVTLAFLPYAPQTRELAKAGRAKGHELIIHTPMEAMDGGLDIGAGGLKEAMGAAEFDAAFKVMLESFDGYAGINNHMGSRLTQDRAKMARLMVMLGGRKLFFLDSKTIEASVGAKEAAKAGVAYAERDVFLDHVDSRAFVDGALRQAESTARRKGYAIAIGHPKDATIEGLRAWIPTLAAKGIELVPVSALLTRPKAAAVREEIVPSVDLFADVPAQPSSGVGEGVPVSGGEGSGLAQPSSSAGEDVPVAVGGGSGAVMSSSGVAEGVPVSGSDVRPVLPFSGAGEGVAGSEGNGLALPPSSAGEDVPVAREGDVGEDGDVSGVSGSGPVMPEGLNLRLRTLSPAP